MSDDPWSGEVHSPTPLNREIVEKRKSQSSQFPSIYHIDLNNIPEIHRVKSSILKDGYAEGTVVLLIGPPGTGKSRYAIQECLLSSGHSLYLYNETVKIKFDYFVSSICKQMGLNSINNVSFCDMSKFLLKTADYDSIKIFASRVWAGVVDEWLSNLKQDPSFVVIDSVSNIGRRYIPQLAVFNKDLIESLFDVYHKHNVKPITFMIHQKSLSPRENNTDSVVGGYGLVHEGDMSVILKLHDVSRWDADRYGWPEGLMIHTLQIAKDRYSISNFNESVISINKNGRLELGDTLYSHVVAVNENKKVYTDSDWP